MKRNFLFPPAGTQLAPDAQKDLVRVARWIRKEGDVQVLVVRFCDPLGSESCTGQLAQQRARSVGQFLLERGVDPAKILSMVGWERAEPICGARTAKCQLMNRRARVFAKNVSGKPL